MSVEINKQQKVSKLLVFFPIALYQKCLRCVISNDGDNDDDNINNK